MCRGVQNHWLNEEEGWFQYPPCQFLIRVVPNEYNFFLRDISSELKVKLGSGFSLHELENCYYALLPVRMLDVAGTQTKPYGYRRLVGRIRRLSCSLGKEDGNYRDHTDFVRDDDHIRFFDQIAISSSSSSSLCWNCSVSVNVLRLIQTLVFGFHTFWSRVLPNLPYTSAFSLLMALPSTKSLWLEFISYSFSYIL